MPDARARTAEVRIHGVRHLIKTLSLAALVADEYARTAVGRGDGERAGVRAGKDADLVLWSDHPLSIYARVNKTLVDGIVYYDADEDIRARQDIAAERARLIQKIRQVAAKLKDKEPKPTEPIYATEIRQGI